MRMGIRSVLALLMVVGSLVAHSDAPAVTFTDNFSTNPFPSRWCERFHHVHWGGVVNQLMLAFTTPGGCNADGGCCAVCNPPGSTIACTSEAANANAVISKIDYSGAARYAAVEFRFPVPLNSSQGEHIPVFPVFHPNCHTGYEAIVAPNGSGGYTLSVGRITDTTRDECNDYEGFFSTSVPVSITTGTTPRYRLSLDIFSGGLNLLNSFGRVYDTVTNQQLAVKQFVTDLPATWYNVTAKRFAIGGINTSTQTNAVRLDNFTGTTN